MSESGESRTKNVKLDAGEVSRLLVSFLMKACAVMGCVLLSDQLGFGWKGGFGIGFIVLATLVSVDLTAQAVCDAIRK